MTFLVHKGTFGRFWVETPGKVRDARLEGHSLVAPDNFRLTLTPEEVLMLEQLEPETEVCLKRSQL